MLYLFDLDGTLIESYMEREDKDYRRVAVLPGRVERLSELLQSGDSIGIVTNQAGVAFGYISEADAHDKIRRSIAALGLPEDTPYAVCFAHSKSRDPRYNNECEVARRKPSGTMIRELAAGWDVSDVLYVGDMDTDKLAAENAGVAFQWAEEFFGC
jgi:D-glycero-D-manno-heptose 1,7-bisphosphate phosphatase